MGNNSDINTHLESLVDTKMDYKNIFVEPICTVPRDDLKDHGIIRKRNINEADVAITKKAKFDVLNKYDTTTCVLYNERINNFVILTNFNGSWWKTKVRDEFNKFIKDSDNIEKIANQLIEQEIIKYYKIIYVGNPLCSSNAKEHSVFCNLNNYKNIIFENDYNAYLNNGKEVLTKDMLESINNILSSNKSNYEIGLQMLYPFDPKPYAYSISKMINKHVKYLGIQNCSYWKSVKFKKYLKLIDLDPSGFNYSIDDLRAKTFKHCGEEDRELIVSEIFNSFSEDFRKQVYFIKDRYQFLKDCQIEVPKFIYNEKDYYNSGE